MNDLDGAVGVDVLDRPAVAILDGDAGVGDEAAVVTPGLYLVADQGGQAIGKGDSAGRLDDFAGVEP